MYRTHFTGYDIAPPTTAPTPEEDIFGGEILPIKAYMYKITFATCFGETTASPASIAITPRFGGVILRNVEVSSNNHVSSKRIYRSMDGEHFYLIATIGANDTEFVDRIMETSADECPDVDPGREKQSP